MLYCIMTSQSFETLFVGGHKHSRNNVALVPASSTLGLPPLHQRLSAYAHVRRKERCWMPALRVR